MTSSTVSSCAVRPGGCGRSLSSRSTNMVTCSAVSGMVHDITDRKEARLKEAERQALISTLSQIRSDVMGTFAIEEILHSATVRAMAALHADSAAILGLELAQWRVREVYGLPSSAVGRAFADDDRYAVSIAARECRPVIVDDTHGDTRADGERAHLFKPGSLAAVPVISRGVATWVIEFMRSKAAPFSEAEADFCLRLMSVIALALDNASAYHRERTIAETLQEALLAPIAAPAGLEVGCLYRPASSNARVGGDFYDLFEVSDGKVAVVIGDVSGKGVEAARLTSLLRNGVRAYAYENLEPALIMEGVNNLVYRSSAIESFATLFVGILDAGSRSLHYCCAGHCPALVVSSGGAPTVLEPQCGMVGAFPHAQFDCDEVLLEPGGLVLLHTDGVTEARQGGELFGEDRLLESLKRAVSLPTSEVPARLLEDVLEFSGGELQDDSAMLVLRLV